MQDQIRIVRVNELEPHPAIIKSLAAIIEEAVREGLANGRYVVKDGVIVKAQQID